MFSITFVRGSLRFSQLLRFLNRLHVLKFTQSFIQLALLFIFRHAQQLSQQPENVEEANPPSDAPPCKPKTTGNVSSCSALSLSSSRSSSNKTTPSSTPQEKTSSFPTVLTNIFKSRITYITIVVLLIACIVYIAISKSQKPTESPTLTQTSAPAPARSKPINPIKEPIVPGTIPVHTRFFAKIPNYAGKPSKIVSMTSYDHDLYVCTSTSGGLIYKVRPNGFTQMWFDVATAMFSTTGRMMSMNNTIHGGLRSLAFHPTFRETGLFYTATMEERSNDAGVASFSRTSNSIPADSVVIEWRYNWQTLVVQPDSYRQVIRIAISLYDHPIKNILFDENNLLIAHGDGSIQSGTAGGGQKNDGLGKILRINPLQQGDDAYTVPTDNPFVSNPKWKNELYAVGFRNPIHMCKSKQEMVGLLVVDVGRDNVDEINIVRPGGNYGWSQREGTFVHKEQGGIITGIGPLPADDEKYKFIYPVVQVGHYSHQPGKRFIGQALTGSCPIENGSPLDNYMLYANFAGTGDLFYSNILEMASARTTGPPSKLSQARTMKPKIFYDHDNNKDTPPVRVQNLRAIIQMDPGKRKEKRADIRFGRGTKGEIYWSSKRNGKIYLFTSTLPSANV